MKTLLHIIFLILMLSIFGCNDKNTSETPSSNLSHGANCFKSEGTPNEYLHLNIENNIVKGIIYIEEEVAGNVFYSFKGKTIDSILQVSVHYSSDDLPQEWAFKLEGDVLTLKNYLAKTSTTKFKRVNCDQLPEKSAYSSVEEIQEEEEAEYKENNLDTK